MTRTAAPLGHSHPAGRRLQLVVAQQPGTDDSPGGVFDDLMDELLPSDVSPGDSSPLPELDAPSDDLTQDLPDTAWEDDPLTDDPLTDDPLTDDDVFDAFGDDLDDDPNVHSAPAVEAPNGVHEDRIEDVFGEQSDSLPIPPPAEVQPPVERQRTEIVPEPPTTTGPRTMTEPPATIELEESPSLDEFMPPSNEPEPRDQNPLRPDRQIPNEAAEQALPLPGDEVVDYNSRDCPAEIADLQDAWNRLRRTPIQAITLDITPSADSNETLEQTDEILPRDAIQRAPSRVWRDRQGELLGEGKLQDFRDGTVFIRDAEQQVTSVSWYDLSNEDLCFVSAWWGIPSEYSPEARPYEVRNWTMSTFTWTASALCHKPLYFEEVQLERYGHTAGPMKQAVLSGVHFFGNIFFLPYHVGLNTPNECQYALGYYRPGDRAPWVIPAVPLSARAFRYQIGALVSGLTLVP